MLFSRNWLQEYINEPLPSVEKLAEQLALRAFEVEGVEAVGNDSVLDLDILPNRAHDALCHWGVAREIATLFDLTFTKPTIQVAADSSVKTAEHIVLDVPDTKLVRRAMKRLVVDVKVAKSPEWLVERLEAIGQRSINNIVDITNFVTFETNQPVHAFDFDKLVGDTKRRVSIRGAKKEETITTLDDETYRLTEGVLVIADSEKALDIAGIKGGVNSGIDANTKRILLSVCNFDPVHIRRTSKTLGLKTDASKRFENEITPELAEVAMERLSQLIQGLAGGRVAEDVLDVYPRRRSPYLLGVSTDEANRVLGTTLSDRDIEDVFRRLGFNYTKVQPIETVLALAATFEGVPYNYGASISYDAPEAFDCSSLVAYLFAQAGISIPRMTMDQYVFGEPVDEKDLKPGDVVFAKGDEEAEVHFESKEFLPGTKVAGGINHCGLYLGGGKVIHASGKWDRGAVVTENMQESKGFQKVVGFRRMILSGKERFVVTVPDERLDLRITEDLIEEIGRVYGYENVVSQVPEKQTEPLVNKAFYYANKIRDILVTEGFSEVYTYTFVDKGDVELANSLSSDKGALRNSLLLGLQESRAHNEKYKDLLGIDAVKIFEIGTVFEKENEHTALGIGASDDTGVLEGIQAVSGALAIELPEQVNNGCIEINLTQLLEKLPEPNAYDDLAEIDTSGVVYTPFSQYPFVLRDIAVWIPNTTNNQQPTTNNASQEELEELLTKQGEDLLVQKNLFDTYEKEDKTSYAYHLVFQSYGKTLSDEEVNEVMESITAEVKKKGWEVR